MPLQVLVSSAGSEAAAAPGRAPQGAGDLAGVPGRGSAELHQPGLSQLRAHQPEPQRPRTIQLRGRSGGLCCFLSTWMNSHGFTCSHMHERTLSQVWVNTRQIHRQHTCACAPTNNQYSSSAKYTSLLYIYHTHFSHKSSILVKFRSLSSDGFIFLSTSLFTTHSETLNPSTPLMLHKWWERESRRMTECVCARA